MKFVACVLFSCFGAFLNAQIYPDNELTDAKYLEDQFYVGLGYNFILDRPDNVVPRNLSYNLQTGFIKDLPLNARRNVALGVGVGYAVNSYYTNLVATKMNETITYEISESDNFKRSKFETHAIEVPLEFRWRSSNALEYKFWRIYAGVRFAYLFSARSKFVPETGDNDSFDNEDVERFQYGPTLNFGYNTFNVHVYYGLNALLKNNVALTDTTNLDLSILRVGVIFYIL